MNNIQIKKSKLPNAGYGVFVTKDYKLGEVITWYSEDCNSTNKAYGVNCSWGPMYARPLAKGSIKSFNKRISEKDIGAGHLINDPLCNLLNIGCYINAYFRENLEERKMYVVACRNISKDQELFISYGFNYWKNHAILQSMSDSSLQHFYRHLDFEDVLRQKNDSLQYAWVTTCFDENQENQSNTKKQDVERLAAIYDLPWSKEKANSQTYCPTWCESDRYYIEYTIFNKEAMEKYQYQIECLECKSTRNV